VSDSVDGELGNAEDNVDRAETSEMMRVRRSMAFNVERSTATVWLSEGLERKRRTGAMAEDGEGRYGWLLMWR
jgi:hypothetical protein